MGGEGGGVLTGWIVAAARAQGLAVQATSVPGVAQRTGGTTYYVEMAERDGLGRAPVFALTPVPGQIDVVLASELAEGARAARQGFATPGRTAVVSSTHRVFLIEEKMAMGDGRIDPAALEATVRARSSRATFLDMDAIAREAGVPISPVMLGALAGAGAMPVETRHFEAAIRDSGIAVERNVAAFKAACERAANLEPAAATVTARAATTSAGSLRPSDFVIAPVQSVHPDAAGFPDTVRDIVSRGIERLADYQDGDYAALYVTRLEPFRSVAPQLLREVARQLALRMSYEDVIRVAQHKARAERFERIRSEVGANTAEPFEVQDFFKPGVREMADILPPRLARWVIARRARSPRLQAAHIGMKVRTTTVSGYLRVWLLAKMRWLRRGTYRYVSEQAAIESWLALIARASDAGNPALALEITELARLIKGYGDTHARGTANYERIVADLVEPTLASGAGDAIAPRVRAAREAALADAEGKSLTAALAAGAPVA
ncbi:unnamed protein product [Phaeothamnion confervicola]